MLKDFYVTRHIPYAQYEDVQEELKNWSITVVAIDNIALESIHAMTERERTDLLATRQNAAFLFKVEQCLDLGAAEEAVDEMLLGVHEHAYDEQVAQDQDALNRADEFAEQFVELE